MNNKAKKGRYLDILLRVPQTVFSTKEIALLWGESNETAARRRLTYYVENKDLIRVRRGLYVKDQEYDRFELAVKIYTPSYISFETVLSRAGVVFQFYSQIFAASYTTREKEIGGQLYVYRKLKESVLTNQAGVERADNYHIASPERAFLDTLYLNKGYYFDNPSPLDWDKVFKILPIYDNNRLEKEVRSYDDKV